VWFACGSVLLLRPDNTVLQTARYSDPLIVSEDQALAMRFGLFLAELGVDYFLPSPDYYLRPMDFARAVDILRCAVDKCTQREIRRPELYEALDFLEKSLDQKWLVHRYRRALTGDRRTWREKQDLRYALRVTARGIQNACSALIVARMNDLGRSFRENRSAIHDLRRQLAIVRKPVP
jgi:hypothetical protein